MRFYKYTVIYKPEKEQGKAYYNVQVPAYPEICTFGDSLEEARFMAQDALELSVRSDLDANILPRQDKKPKTVTRPNKKEELVIAVSHQVSATPYDYVKDALFATA